MTMKPHIGLQVDPLHEVAGAPVRPARRDRLRNFMERGNPDQGAGLAGEGTGCRQKSVGLGTFAHEPSQREPI